MADVQGGEASYEFQPPSQPFSPSDAWLLLAVLYAGQGATREQVIAAGDYINHAIFTRDELDGGLERLIEAGLVLVQEGRHSASEAVREWFSTVSKPRSPVFKDLERVEAFLANATGRT